MHLRSSRKTCLVGTDLNSKPALISTLVSGILAVVHLGITAPLKSVREGIEVVSAGYVLSSGYTLANSVGDSEGNIHLVTTGAVIPPAAPL